MAGIEEAGGGAAAVVSPGGIACEGAGMTVEMMGCVWSPMMIPGAVVGEPSAAVVEMSTVWKVEGGGTTTGVSALLAGGGAADTTGTADGEFCSAGGWTVPMVWGGGLLLLSSFVVSGFWVIGAAVSAGGGWTVGAGDSCFVPSVGLVSAGGCVGEVSGSSGELVGGGAAVVGSSSPSSNEVEVSVMNEAVIRASAGAG